MDIEGSLKEASDALKECTMLLVLTGAGFSKDSGLPVFNEVPRYLSLCSPKALEEQPEEFYGFFGRAMQLYDATQPHEGYKVLHELASRANLDTLIVTSNVDSALQKAGFANVVEIHGSLRDWQCERGLKCGSKTFSVKGFDFDFDPDTGNAQSFPECPECGAKARPAVLMFQDENWVGSEKKDAETKIHDWMAQCIRRMRQSKHEKLCVIEIGCGDRVPTLRTIGEDLLQRLWETGALWNSTEITTRTTSRAKLIRINPDPLLSTVVRNSAKHLQDMAVVSIAMKGREALLSI